MRTKLLLFSFCAPHPRLCPLLLLLLSLPRFPFPSRFPATVGEERQGVPSPACPISLLGPTQSNGALQSRSKVEFNKFTRLEPINWAIKSFMRLIYIQCHGLATQWRLGASSLKAAERGCEGGRGAGARRVRIALCSARLGSALPEDLIQGYIRKLLSAWLRRWPLPSWPFESQLPLPKSLQRTGMLWSKEEQCRL